MVYVSINEFQKEHTLLAHKLLGIWPEEMKQQAPQTVQSSPLGTNQLNRKINSKMIHN